MFVLLHNPSDIGNYFQSLFFAVPLYGPASFPSVRAGNTWWCMLYVAIGTGIPALLDIGHKKTKESLRKRNRAD